ncbi:glycosyltransferase [Dyadobacter sp. CY347]|uniref:glycosyltransferase n=1 Tax=Dyadobacter sp. CY347 TaxID=2909336 RepID=UPI001F3DB8B7|nr:glycosyltransferase [Dyadobacter sp. CY347]MCF2491512.1 glycosyltransferase [Dyadobacter sp. CY347]
MSLNFGTKYFFLACLNGGKKVIDRVLSGKYFKKRPVNQLLDENSDTTVILTVWKRGHLAEQLNALSNQMQKPCQVWVYHCADHINIKGILKLYPEVSLIHSAVNLKYFGRFSLAQYVTSKFVWVLDDDVIPSVNWLDMSKKMCVEQNAIIASAGRIIPNGDYFPEQPTNTSRFFYGDVSPRYSWNFCPENTIVDFGCNSWFFQKHWVQHLWQIPPFTLDTAEDMHLSAVLNLKMGIKTIVPKQTDIESTGNLKIMYGRDRDASWIKYDFLKKREQVLRYLIDDHGWQPQLWLKNTEPESLYNASDV